MDANLGPRCQTRAISHRVLDQQYLIPHFAVHQLIHNALRQQTAISPGPHAQFIAVLDMGGRIIRSIRYCGMSNGVTARPIDCA